MLHYYVTDMAARVTPNIQIPYNLPTVPDMAACVTPTMQTLKYLGLHSGYDNHQSVVKPQSACVKQLA